MKRYIRSSINDTSIQKLGELSRMKLAEDSDSEEILRLLAKDESYLVRRYVADNPDSPKDILSMLAQDEDTIVRTLADINREDSSIDNIELLARDKDPKVRRAVAESRTTPEHILKLLARDKDVNVRDSVVWNTNTPIEAIELLARDKNSVVRAYAVRRVSSESLLEKLADDRNAEVREEVALNTHTPAEVLRKLVNDTNKYVRDAASRNPNTPKDGSTSSSDSWASLKRNLKSDTEDGVDPLYEQTEAGEQLQNICTAVEDKLGIWLEPSIQGGMGGIWFYSKDDEILAENYDYETYNEEVIGLATESKTQKEFQSRYKQYLQDILNDTAYQPSEE